MIQFDDAEVAKIAARYVGAATTHGNATEIGDYKTANSAAGEIAEAHRALREFGRPGEVALIELLHHLERGVRLWAASHALWFATEESERVLADLAAEKDSLIAFSAETTLRRWREGTLSH